MGAIRTDLVYANPRFELCGVCDVDLEAAERVADTYSVRYFASQWFGELRAYNDARTNSMAKI
jgi:predicted dehydrogenase